MVGLGGRSPGGFGSCLVSIAGIEGLLVIGVARAAEAERVIGLLGRLCAMLVRLERVRR